jgi:hypothetical protein
MMLLPLLLLLLLLLSLRALWECFKACRCGPISRRAALYYFS